MKNLSARIYTGTISRIILAVVFAALCTGMQYAELWQESSKVEVGKPAPVTLRLPPGYFRITMLRNEFHYLPASSAGCPDMVAKGTAVEPSTECAGLVNAFENNRRPVGLARLVGSFVLFLMSGFLLSSYMCKDGMGRARWLRSQMSVFGLIVLLGGVSKAILLYTAFPFAVLPVAMVPLLVSMLLGRRMSFGVTLCSALVAASMLHFNVQTLLVFLAAGVSTAVAANTYKKRIVATVKASLLASLSTVVATALTTLLFAGTLDIYEDLGDHFNPVTSIWLAGLMGGIGSGFLSLLLLPLFSLLVGEVPRAKLFDLLELDHPLLKQIRTRAPSTWEHSRAMANLGEAAAHAIGGNAMLLRVGAYFHDVGKSLRPDFFIENQGGEKNPHDELTPYDSARAIFSHVIDGVKLLRKERVPEDVIEFSYSHHGTSILEYFWYKNLKQGNPEKLSEIDFSYPGNKPTTRETAILMIVDAMEAAARTVEKPDKAKFESLLQRIVFGKMAQGQFDESGLTMHDLRIVITTIIDTLVSMYHARIKYPWQEESPSGSTAAEGGSTKEKSSGELAASGDATPSFLSATPVSDARASTGENDLASAPMESETPEQIIENAVVISPAINAATDRDTPTVEVAKEVRKVDDAIPTIIPPKADAPPKITETASSETPFEKKPKR